MPRKYSPPKGKGRDKNPNRGTVSDPEKVAAVFTAWNSAGIIVHRIFRPRMITAIQTALKSYSVEEIVQAIQNYAKIVKSPEHFWEYRWPVDQFMNLGLERFMDWNTADVNFKRKGPTGEWTPPKDRADLEREYIWGRKAVYNPHAKTWVKGEQVLSQEEKEKLYEKLYGGKRPGSTTEEANTRLSGHGT